MHAQNGRFSSRPPNRLFICYSKPAYHVVFLPLGTIGRQDVSERAGHTVVRERQNLPFPSKGTAGSAIF